MNRYSPICIPAKVPRALMIAALLLWVSLLGTAYADGPVPDTGQTTSYTDTFGEDSDYLINPPSYSKLGLDGIELDDTATQAEGWIMTRDNVTRLIWEIKTVDGSIHDRVNRYTWCDTDPATNGGDSGTCGDGTDTEDFIAALNAENFGGFSDWRMPTRKELRTIVDYGTYYPFPVIDELFFPNCILSRYWSSDTINALPTTAWYIGFDFGYDYHMYKNSEYFVRAVRGGHSQSVIQSTLIDNGDGTVTDTDTGLMWQQHEDNVLQRWEEALVYCEDATLAGYDDWRLPTHKELDSIVDLTRYGPVIDPVFGETDLSGFKFWSSTTYAKETNSKWVISFTSGDDYTYLNGMGNYVRAVRGGQNQVAGHLLISTPNQADVVMMGETKTILWNTQGISGDVSITLSRDGGKTFSETLSGSTPNDGTFEWAVSGEPSYNCVLKITPLDDTDKATSQGLFTISTINDPDGSTVAPWVPLLLLDD